MILPGSMRLKTYHNTPLWFDLLLATGVIALAHGLDQVIYPPRQTPRFDEVIPPKDRESQYQPEDRERQYRDDHLKLGKRHRHPPFARALQPAANTSGGDGQGPSPIAIPASGWKDIFWRTYKQIGDDRLLAVAAGVVFYMLLALFPAITALHVKPRQCRYLSGTTSSCCVVSTTNMASSRAGFVELALALTL